MSGVPTQGLWRWWHDAAGGPERLFCLLAFPFVKRGWGAGASLVRHRKGRGTCGVQSAQAHISLQTRSLAARALAWHSMGRGEAAVSGPPCGPGAHHLLPFPWEPRVRPPGRGGRVGLRQTRGVGCGRGQVSSSPSVLSGGRDMTRVGASQTTMPSLPFSWLSL